MGRRHRTRRLRFSSPPGGVRRRSARLPIRRRAPLPRASWRFSNGSDDYVGKSTTDYQHRLPTARIRLGDALGPQRRGGVLRELAQQRRHRTPSAPGRGPRRIRPRPHRGGITVTGAPGPAGASTGTRRRHGCSPWTWSTATARRPGHSFPVETLTHWRERGKLATPYGPQFRSARCGLARRRWCCRTCLEV